MYKTARTLGVLGFGLSASAVVGWLLLRENKRVKETSGLSAKQQSDLVEQLDLSEIVLPLEILDSDESAVTNTDDLTLITGIGPRYADALRAAGIVSFKDQANFTPEALAERLSPYVSVRPERIRNSAWVEQAAQFAKS
jgi:hypothetical protein